MFGGGLIKSVQFFIRFQILYKSNDLIFLVVCSTDDGGGLGPENASDQINAIAGELNDDVVTLVQSEGVNGALSLIDLMENSEEFGRVSPYHPDENRALVAI